MIRHARRYRDHALPIPALPVAVIQPAFRTLLVAAVAAAPLLQTGLPAALVAAIAMAAITVGADVEQRLAVRPAARSLAQNRRIMKCRLHRRRWRG